MKNKTLYKTIKNYKPISAWNKGLKVFALEIVESAEKYITADNIKEVVLNGGDVLARARIRYDEIRQSLSSLYLLLSSLPEVSPCVSATRDISLPSDTIGVSLVESWRGEVCHVALTDGEGRFMKYKIVDPSFHNWFGLAMSMRDEQVSHFPLCNKSFNLSCCGHDL